LASIGTQMSKADIESQVRAYRHKYYLKNRERIQAATKAAYYADVEASRERARIQGKARRRKPKSTERRLMDKLKQQRRHALKNNRRDTVSATLETWSTKDLITIGFDKCGLPIDLNRIELRMLIESLQDLEGLELPDMTEEGDTVYKEFCIKEDQG